MIRNYLVIAWRSLLKNRLFSFINIIGLALSLSVGVLVLTRVSDAFNYDNFHSEQENIYRIISDVVTSKGDKWVFASTPLPLKSNITNTTATLLYPGVNSTISDGAREFDIRGAYIDAKFFEVFGFELLNGRANSMNDAYKVLLTEEIANKLFRDVSPLGKSVTIGGHDFEISGVIKTAPGKSHINYEVFLSMASADARELQNWDTYKSGYTYVRLNSEIEKEALINEFAQLSQELNKSEDQKLQFELQPLTSISPPSSDIYNEISRSTTKGSLMAEILIALVVLAAACFNYANLSISRALTRGKEIGVRKLSGATRIQIISQFMTEALLISVLALVVSNFILAPILEFQPFNDGYEMIPELQINGRFIALVTGFTLLTSLLAGGLPSWLLSSFRSARILRGFASDKLMGNFTLRKTLLVLQFSLSLFVLIFLSIFYRQFDFLAKADLLYNQDGIVLVSKGIKSEVTSASIEKFADVKQVALVSGKFGSGMTVNVSRDLQEEKPAAFDLYSCTQEWVEMASLTTMAGSKQIASRSVLINEKASVNLGFKNADEAVGSKLYIQSSPYMIAGVVKDFYANGYGNPVRPIVLQHDTTLARFIAIQAIHTPTQDLIRNIEAEWVKQNPGHTFDYISLEEDRAKRENQTATLSMLGFLGLITISIASLGLLGLVVYTVEVKRKEISIRKIVGASVTQIVTLLSTGFATLLGIAGAIALPIGYFAGELFLTNFINRVSVGLPILIGCFLFLSIIGLVTILSQTLKAANENPSRNLRSE